MSRYFHDKTSIDYRKRKVDEEKVIPIVEKIKLDADNPKQHHRLQNQNKKWRLIVRNLAFSTTKADLQNIFCKFGPFSEIILPPCRDKRYSESCAGFGFVQYLQHSVAVKARNSLNMTELNGRKIAIDWAIPKDEYETAIHDEKKTTEEDIKPVVKKVRFDDDNASDDADLSDDSEDIKVEKSSSSDDESDLEKAKEVANDKKISNRKPDTALQEGRALFVRNLAFETTDDILREKFISFGDVKLAIVCKYPGTNHSKGSGFIHFVERTSADACIIAADTDVGIVLDGRRLFVNRAVDRNEAARIEKTKLEKTPKDNRNLHLLRLSAIRPGTAEAGNMSEADARKRQKLQLTTRSKLTNLNMFVSPTRLTIHNLPTSLRDVDLRELCLKAVNDSTAIIRECRIWRDKDRSNSSGVAKSRGFAFVDFAEHRHALAALLHLNNNANSFTNEKRPIVEFSIENRIALQLKQSRIEKSNRNRQQSTNNDKTIVPSVVSTSSSLKVRDETKRLPADLEKTKKMLASSGKKPLPSHIGPKIRHRNRNDAKVNLKTKNTKKNNSKVKNMKKNNGNSTDKRKKLSKKKLLTKYLTLS